MKLAIILAARGRPELLRRTVETTLPNIKCDDTRLVIAVDDDDPAVCDVAGQLFEKSSKISVSKETRDITLGDKYNRALKVAPADVYLAMVDYAQHVTPGFDEKILEAASVFPDGIGVVYNHLANLSFPQINAVTAGLVERMGYFYPPYFPYWFVDHWLDDIAKLIDRISVADVWIDTSHRPGTMDRRDIAFWATFFDAGYIHRREIAHRIINSDSFQEPQWRKNLLLRHHPLIEERSKMLNQGVKHTQWHQPPEAPDARYSKAKARAQSMLRDFIPQIEAEEAARHLMRSY